MAKEQIPPQGDSRYRVHRSVKCYVAQLICGTKWCTWDFTQSAQRVVYKDERGNESVVYRNRHYPLRTPEEMAELVHRHLSDKGAVNILGTYLNHAEKNKAFAPYHFIDITPKEERAIYQELRPIWLASDDFKRA